MQWGYNLDERNKKKEAKGPDPRVFSDFLMSADISGGGDDDMSYLRPGIPVGDSQGPVDAPKPIGGLG